MTKEDALLLVQEQFESHNGEWITMDAAYSYANKINNSNGTNSDQIHQIRLELQHQFGVTELEAINISNGKNINDYVQKYQRIKQQLPLNICNFIPSDDDEFYDDGFSFEEPDSSEDK